MPESVAVIDIGSNSIKVLVATREADGRIRALLSKTIDARISAGISQAAPRLTVESMNRGVAAIQQLLASAADFAPRQTVLVATSAVRDAENGDTFRARVREATGHEIRILSGSEEANLIGHGLTCDPALSDLRDFHVFDLGGGSLECLAFRNRQIERAASLQLGCVRLTEKFIPDPGAPLTPDACAAIGAHVRTALARSFNSPLPTGTAAIGTGGTVTTVRAILAARAGVTLDQTSPNVVVADLRLLLADLGSQALVERHRVAGLPAARADVFPTALITLITIAETMGVSSFRHSFYNLRFGLAADALGSG